VEGELHGRRRRAPPSPSSSQLAPEPPPCYPGWPRDLATAEMSVPAVLHGEHGRAGGRGGVGAREKRSGVRACDGVLPAASFPVAQIQPGMLLRLAPPQAGSDLEVHGWWCARRIQGRRQPPQARPRHLRPASSLGRRRPFFLVDGVVLLSRSPTSRGSQLSRGDAQGERSTAGGRPPLRDGSICIRQFFADALRQPAGDSLTNGYATFFLVNWWARRV
jgi:hypothetical protein